MSYRSESHQKHELSRQTCMLAWQVRLGGVAPKGDSCGWPKHNNKLIDGSSIILSTGIVALLSPHRFDEFYNEYFTKTQLHVYFY